MRSALRIAIVRHGAAHYGQDLDTTRPLTTEGLNQAQRLGCWLSSGAWHEASLFSSPFVRAHETALAIGSALQHSLSSIPCLQPDGSPQVVADWLATQTNNIILVSHLPLVGRLASLLVDGQVYDQPWSPAECWVLEGDLAAPGCMSVVDVWYPALDE